MIFRAWIGHCLHQNPHLSKFIEALVLRNLIQNLNEKLFDSFQHFPSPALEFSVECIEKIETKLKCGTHAHTDVF